MQNPFYDFKKNKFVELESRLAILVQLLDYNVSDPSDLLCEVKNASFMMVVNPLIKMLDADDKVSYKGIESMVNMAHLRRIEASVFEDIQNKAAQNNAEIYGDSVDAGLAFDKTITSLIFSYGCGRILWQELAVIDYTKESRLNPTYTVSVKTYINNQKWEVSTVDGELNPLTPTLLNGEVPSDDEFGFMGSVKRTIETISSIKAKGHIAYISTDKLMDLEGLAFKADSIAKIIGGEAKNHIQLAQSLNSGLISKKDAGDWLTLDYNCTVKQVANIIPIFDNRLLA